jgi:endonuclease/exonuclease/phosphatase family metal-dependent hydrolase
MDLANIKLRKVPPSEQKIISNKEIYEMAKKREEEEMFDSFEINPYVYEDEKWTKNPQQFEQRVQNEDKIDLNSITCVTYNVWFDSYEQSIRYNALLDIVHQQDADVVCLQEVTSSFLDIACSKDWIQADYVLTEATPSNFTIDPYGVILMIHKRVFTKYATERPKVMLHQLPSKMSRHLIIVSFITLSNENITIATVHLESLDQKVYRYKQLKLIERILKCSNVALLVGDFNMDSESNYDANDKAVLEENQMQKLLSEYVDIWRELKYPDLGKTRDPTRNNMERKGINLCVLIV